MVSPVPGHQVVWTESKDLKVSESSSGTIVWMRMGSCNTFLYHSVHSGDKTSTTACMCIEEREHELL